MSVLTIKEVAERLKVSGDRIKEWREKGKFPNAYREKNRWMIPEEDVKVFDSIAKDLSPKQLVEVIGLSLPVIREHLRKGHFPNAYQIETNWYVPKSDVPLFLEIRNEWLSREKKPRVRKKEEKPQIDWSMYVSVWEAAEMIEVKTSTVQLHISNGIFQSARKNVQNEWMIERKEIENYILQNKRYVTKKEVAEMFHKHEGSVARWLQEGILPGAYQGSRGIWMIPFESVENIPKLDNVDATIVRTVKDEIGKRYNDLTVLEVTGYKKEGQQNKIHVNVGCECGKITEKPLYAVKEERVKRCGRDCFLNTNVQLGERFGFLTVIGEGEIRTSESNGKKKSRRWIEVRCDCGEKKMLSMNKIKKGEQNSCTKSCSVWHIPMIGKKFGNLTVIKELERIKNLERRRKFLCQCDCGEPLVEKEYQKLVSGETKYCGLRCKLKRGEGSPFWKPEISMEERIKERDYWEYTQWRTKVFIRDNFTCQNCLKRGSGNLAAHHKDGYNWCKEKRTDVDNGVTLCEECHKEFHQEYGYGENTIKQFENWMSNKEEKVNEYVNG